MEAVKGVIFGHDKTEFGHKYLLGLVLVTDEELQLVEPRGETIVMGGNSANLITLGLQGLGKYLPPHPLGDLSSAVILTADLKPENLEKKK